MRQRHNVSVILSSLLLSATLTQRACRSDDALFSGTAACRGCGADMRRHIFCGDDNVSCAALKPHGSVLRSVEARTTNAVYAVPGNVRRG